MRILVADASMPHTPSTKRPLQVYTTMHRGAPLKHIFKREHNNLSGFFFFNKTVQKGLKFNLLRNNYFFSYTYFPGAVRKKRCRLN